MIKDLKNEMNSFLNELEKTIKNENELIHIKKITDKLFTVFVDELENALNYKENEIKKIEQRQEEAMERIDEMDVVIKNITRDIYDDEEDFAIICPYCNYEFDADVDETYTEIICPECQNEIELDWGIDQEPNCGGGCSGCSGCNQDDEK